MWGANPVNGTPFCDDKKCTLNFIQNNFYYGHIYIFKKKNVLALSFLLLLFFGGGGGVVFLFLFLFLFFVFCLFLVLFTIFRFRTTFFEVAETIDSCTKS